MISSKGTYQQALCQARAIDGQSRARAVIYFSDGPTCSLPKPRPPLHKSHKGLQISKWHSRTEQRHASESACQNDVAASLS
eukprot:8711261-Alexandrium_andersonii.AAC.1